MIRQRKGVGDAANDILPAERNTICIVGGTLNANTRLFSSVPEAKVATWSRCCATGTWRGLSRGSQESESESERRDSLFQVMKDGSCCAVMKSICENVSAVPVPSQTSQSETQGLDWIGENALAIAYGGGSCIIGVWMDRRRFYTVRTDIRLCAEQFLVNPDIPTAIVMKDRSTQKPEPITYEQQPPKTKNSIKE